MFGMMFGDAGQGLLLVGAAAALRAGWPRWARRFRPAWPFVGGAGLAATVFGLLYGEFFGPTGVVPTLWLDPLGQPITLLLAAIGIGAVLLAGAYALGTINRWREGGWPLALYAPSGIAGAASSSARRAGRRRVVLPSGAAGRRRRVLGRGRAGLAFAGFLAEAGGGGAGVMQASVEAVRPGRPAGLQRRVLRPAGRVRPRPRRARPARLGGHAGAVAPRRAADRGRGGPVRRRNRAGVRLEALVAAIQALRLEYYELFSRVFVARGGRSGRGTCRTVDRPRARPWRARASGAQRAGSGVRNGCLADRVAADRRRAAAGARWPRGAGGAAWSSWP